MLKGEHMQATDTLILSFKAKGRNDQRIYALVCTLIDTGIRISNYSAS